jgi:hypothetical protein
MWLVTGGGILALAIAIAGARGNVPVAIGIAGGVLFAISILWA